MSIEAVVRTIYSRNPPKGGQNVSARDCLLVWQSYAEQADPSGRPPYPSPSGYTLALELGMDRRTFRNALVALCAQSYLRLVGDAIPRVTGDQYEVRFPATTRAGISTKLGRGNQPDSGGDINLLNASESGGDINPTRAGDSGGGLGRGIPAPSLSLSLTPPTSENNCKSRAREHHRRRPRPHR